MKNKYFNNTELCDELFEKISNKFGDRFIGDLWKISYGAVLGTIDSNEFLIRPYLTRDGSIGGLVVSALSEQESKVLDELVPLLKEFMNNANPICKFDLIVEFDVNNNIISKITKTMPTIEWNISVPEKRLASIINGDIISENEKIVNLELFNGKEISDYLETDQISTKRKR